VYHFASFKATQRDVLEDVRGLADVIVRKGWGIGVNAGKNDIDMERDDSEEEEEATLARACVPPGAYVSAIALQSMPPQRNLLSLNFSKSFLFSCESPCRYNCLIFA
jgi:hypothetical protein